MPQPAKNYYTGKTYPTYPQQQNPYGQTVVRQLPQRKKIINPQKRIKKVNPLKRFISFVLLGLFAYYIMPTGFELVSKPLISNGAHREVHINAHELRFPTTNYLSNSLIFNQRFLLPAETKKPQMTSLYMTDKMPVLEVKLQKLAKAYPALSSAIYVWDFDSGKYVDINGDKIFSAASIIKIPVLIRLFKSIESNQLTIYDEMTLADYYKASGSGDLQYKPTNSKYTVDQLARVMITDSDNSATNMLMSKMGSMTDVNQGLRDWGIKHTQVKNWLPDLAGTNYTTAHDLATMLYNLDNPSFLNLSSREYIIDYMSKVKNNRLIQAGIAPNALFVHKTGDIGKMLGDAGIVYLPNGGKYIVAILVNRPYNSPQGKDFIQQASSLIYKTMTSTKY